MVAARSLRLVFFGTPAFAVPSLDALLESSHQVVGVVTQPDRPRGRGQRVSDAPIKMRAKAAGLTILQPERLRTSEFRDQLTALGAELGVVAAYGKILTDDVLATPPLGLINVHASLLPKYRGAAPVHRAIIAGERETGVTIMRVVKALDAGPMLASTSRAIAEEATSEDVERDLASLGARLLVQTVDRLSSGPVTEVPQDDALATYAPRLTKSDGLIDWTQSARRIHDLIRGLHPWPLAFSFLGDRRIIIRRATLASGPAGSEPGTVVEVAANRLVVRSSDGGIAIAELQLEGKRPMSVAEFLAGHRIAPGDRFTSSP